MALKRWPAIAEGVSMLSLASGYSTGYAVGQLCAIAALAVLAVVLARRAVRRRRAEALTPPPVRAAAPAASGSVAPPGWSEPERPAAPAAGVPGRRVHTSWRSDALATAVCCVLLAAALVRGVGYDGGHEAGPADPWASDQGQALRAGFVEGCRRKDPTGTIPCVCIFDQLKLRAPGPVQFVQLTSAMEAAWQARDVRLLRPEVVAAFRACPAGAG